MKSFRVFSSVPNEHSYAGQIVALEPIGQGYPLEIRTSDPELLESLKVCGIVSLVPVLPAGPKKPESSVGREDNPDYDTQGVGGF